MWLNTGTFIFGRHLYYGGNSTEFTKIHNARPDKNLYFTEMSIGTWNYTFDGDLMWTMKEIGIGALNRFSKAVIVWNYMLDDKRGPNRQGGCTTCFGNCHGITLFTT